MDKNIKILIIVLALVVALIVPATIKYKFDKQAQRLYNQGIEYYNNLDYSNAYYNFNQIKKISKLYPLALLKCFQCANNLQDKKTAQNTIKELVKTIKDENIRPYILYSDAILSQEAETDSVAKQMKKFKYIFENYSGNDYSYASEFKYAKLIQEQDKNTAKKHYINYLSYAPNGKFALEAMNFLSSNELDFNQEESEILAKAYLKNDNYLNALEYFKNSKFENNWVDISRCYKNLKNSSLENDTIRKGLALKYSNVEEKEISYALERFISLNGGNKIQTLQEIYSFYSNSYIIPTVEYKLAEAMTSLRSLKLYEDIVEKHPNSFWASNSLWELVWYNYKEKRFKSCEELVKTHFEEQAHTQDAPRISYWYAKALLNQRKNLEAKEAFHKTINDYPLSFYAFLSARQLKISKTRKIISKKPIAKYNLETINKNLFKNPTLFLLAQYDDWQTIEDLKIDDVFVKAWILNKKGQYPLSINTIKKEYLENYEKKHSFSDWQLKLLNPVLFEDEINEIAKQYKRSPYLFLSLVREESHFNKEAKSPVGALGLSQVMPATADFITKRQVSKEELLNAEKNIKIGLKYYDYLVEFFDGNEFLAIMAYNAGPGNINKWLKDRISSTNEIDMFIESVPYLETKNYIKKILSSYWIYLNVYSNKYVL